jgi:competence protein ComEC
VREVKQGDAWQPAAGTCLLTVPRYPDYAYGDMLQLKGRLETPETGSFDYRAYLARQGVSWTMYYPHVERLDTGEGNRLLSWVYSLRDWLSASLGKILPEPQAALAQGITLGDRGTIPTTIEDDFVRSGTAHVLAISGVNLTIIAGILVALTIWLLGRRYYIYIWVTLAMAWLYALLTGLEPPVLRAAVMLSVFLLADLFGRQRNGLVALLVAAAVMAGISPPVLGDASFQMSFAAMVGLVLVAPPLQAAGRRLVGAYDGQGPLRSAAAFLTDSLAVSLAAVVAVWPLIAHYFGLVSWVGPIATLLALPALTAIIIGGMLAGGLGLLFLPLGQVIGWLVWLPLSYLLLVAKGFAALPGASLPTGPSPIGLLVAYYVLLGLALLATSHRQALARAGRAAAVFISGMPRKWVVPALAVVALLVWAGALAMPDDNVHVTFLDVGQGDAILISRGSRQILIDGGPSPQAVTLGLGREMPFWDRTIDVVVTTHPEADHLTGLVEVARRYRVEQVIEGQADNESALWQAWDRTLAERGIPRTTAAIGQRISLGDGVTIEVLNPSGAADWQTSLNDRSIVLKVTVGKVSFLLTGDVEEAAETDMITRRADLASTVLKVAHHGSDTSTSEAFLALVRPQVAVVSVGKDNAYAQPSPSVTARLESLLGPANLYRTDRNGTIEFITDGQRLWVKTER